jgi:hypothetical protein
MNDHKDVPQGLKPSSCWDGAARLKACPSWREFFPASMGLGEQEWKPRISPLRYPGFPVQVGGVGKHHAPFLKERRTRCLVQYRVAGKSGYAPVEMTNLWVIDDPFPMETRLQLCNNLVISTEAQRSGETCGFHSRSTARINDVVLGLQHR